MEKTRTILVYVGLDLIGDGLIKLPFVRALRTAFPEAHITWLAGKGKSVYRDRLNPLVENLIDEVIDDAGFRPNGPNLTQRPLPGRSFDLIIDTQRRFWTTVLLRRIPHRLFLSSCCNYLLSDKRPSGAPFFGYRKPPAMIRQLLELAALAGARGSETSAGVELPGAARAEAARLLPGTAKRVALAPGAGGRHKCWPLERFADLANRLSADGIQPVVLLGPDEDEWQAPLERDCPMAVFPLSRARRELYMDPLLTMALAEACDACVANDSGVGNILAAAGRPLVSLFGPTSPEKFAPITKRGVVVRAQSFGGSNRMADIPVRAVVDALAPLLADAEDEPQRTA